VKHHLPRLEDAEIAEYNLTTLVDDKKVFPAYDAVFLYRKELETEAPLFISTLKLLENKISDNEMIQMNLEVKVQKKSESEVAQKFLSQLNILSKNTTRSFWQQIYKDTLSHLFLVCISLSFAILVAVPLGVLARFYPKFSEVIIGLCSVIQTIPSLALLVFMIPFLGIGKLPAMVALFLYALLPILRNTYMGLIQIPSSLLDSAIGLGLPTSYRLFKIELPLALRSILAGIKTSAVITVGTATLGAIIGAGGYGETILMGVRRDDTFLILRGAIPAAVMAMCVQYFFEKIEKQIVQ
jgi:osmoprotectant transport system permease protein